MGLQKAGLRACIKCSECNTEGDMIYQGFRQVVEGLHAGFPASKRLARTAQPLSLHPKAPWTQTVKHFALKVVPIWVPGAQSIYYCFGYMDRPNPNAPGNLE